ncbi:MAG: hypothetical protein ABJL67_14520 [Sulfitobacter sp.]
MVETRDHFENRLNTLGRKHQKMTHGFTTKIDKNGLLVATPVRRTRIRGMGPVKIFALIAIGFFGFKAFTLASIGPVTYNERLAKLENGTMVEQAGAMLLAIDPVTEAMVGSVAPVVR